MWFLVDMAEPDKVIRHVPKEGMARARSLHRAIRPAGLAAAAGAVIAQAAESGRRCERAVLLRGEAHRVLAIPVPGPDGVPLAVRLWAGASRVEPPDPPAVDAFVWDSRQWMLRNHGGGGGPVLPEGHPLLHGAWFLSRVIECEDRDRLMTAALDPKPGVAWRGPMQVRTPDDRTARVFGFLRYHADGALRGLLLEVAADRAPGLVPATYRDDAAIALLGGTTALIDAETMQIIEWLTPPLGDIAWRHHPASRGIDPDDDGREFTLTTTHLVHPDDVNGYLGALRELAERRSERTRVAVRLLTLRRDWQPVELYGARLPRGLPRFLICLIRPVGSDPVPE
ncbi:GAF domain-containing protein [Nocardia xishanensis]